MSKQVSCDERKSFLVATDREITCPRINRYPPGGSGKMIFEHSIISPTIITEQRRDALESLGYVIPCLHHDIVSDKWEKSLENLMLYNKLRGDCLVPVAHPVNALGEWVMIQRKEYKNLREGKPSTLTKEQISSLQGLGFAWVAPEQESKHINQPLELSENPNKVNKCTSHLINSVVQTKGVNAVAPGTSDDMNVQRQHAIQMTSVRKYSSEMQNMVISIVKPKRPLTAYNYFFKYERARLISTMSSSSSSSPDLIQSKENLFDKEKNDEKEQHPLPCKFSSNPSLCVNGKLQNKENCHGMVDCSSEAHYNTENKKKKRRGRPPGPNYKGPRASPHKKISFSDLGKLIGQRWKKIIPQQKKCFTILADQDRKRYRTAMKEYKAEMKKRKYVTKHD